MLSVCPFLQAFTAEINALESQESITSKIQAKNNQLISINQEIEDYNFQMREMANERQKYSDCIR